MFMRSDHMNNFTMAQNDLIQDDRLSLEARGLMMYILSLPDDWAFSVKGLANQCKVSEATVNRLVNELKACGYIVINKKQNKRGQFGAYEWDIIENAETVKNRTSENTELGKNRTSESPNLGKSGDIQSTNINKVLNITKGEKIKEKNPGKKADAFDAILETLNPDLRDVFKEFIKMRKAIKAPLTERALNIAIKKANDLGGGKPDVIKAIVEQSILNNWKSFYPLKDAGKAYTAPIQDGETQLQRLTRLALERAEGGNV